RHPRVVGVSRGAQRVADAQRGRNERRLEGASEAEPRALVRRQRRDAALAARDRAAIRMHAAREHVEERGLAGPVGTGKTEDLSCVDRDLDVVEGHERPVCLADAAAGERGHPVLSPSTYIPGGSLNGPSTYGAGWMILCTLFWIWKNRCAWPRPGSGVCAG